MFAPAVGSSWDRVAPKTLSTARPSGRPGPSGVAAPSFRMPGPGRSGSAPPARSAGLPPTPVECRRPHGDAHRVRHHKMGRPFRRSRSRRLPRAVGRCRRSTRHCRNCRARQPREKRLAARPSTTSRRRFQPPVRPRLIPHRTLDCRPPPRALSRAHPSGVSSNIHIRIPGDHIAAR